jgi:5-hydroxyisourate hydrolase
MTGRLTTHVLDTATGRPAAGLRITLRRGGAVLGRFVTNADGRCDGPLLEGESLVAGEYELLFDVGAWRDGGFYREIPIRFCVDDASGHTHVPLLLSPFGYSTYRGS